MTFILVGNQVWYLRKTRLLGASAIVRALLLASRKHLFMFVEMARSGETVRRASALSYPVDVGVLPSRISGLRWLVLSYKLGVVMGSALRSLAYR